MREAEKDVSEMIARGSQAAGLIFCAAGAVMGLVLMDSGFLQGAMGLVMGLQQVLPTLGVGILLVVAGRTLGAVTGPPA
jgi:hypothetical protein